MPGIDRYIDVLNLFTIEKSSWTAAELAAELGVPSSTVYRTLRELKRVNMLDAAREGHYRLGPAFIDYDRRTRLTDPLTRRAQSILGELVRHAGVPCIALLARLYGNTVMCVADTRSQADAVQSSYERGRPMPLTRGATSKAILAQLPARRLARLLASASPPMAPAGVDLFRAELARNRKTGYAIGQGEVDERHVGVAVPVAVPEQDVIASLSLVLHERDWTEETEHRVVLLLVSSAALLQQQLTSVPPRDSR